MSCINLCLSHVFDQLPRDGYSLLGAEAAVTVLLSSLQFLNSSARELPNFCGKKWLSPQIRDNAERHMQPNKVNMQLYMINMFCIISLLKMYLSLQKQIRV